MEPNERKNAWWKWIESFRFLWEPPIPKTKAERELADLFGFDKVRNVSTLYEKKGNSRATGKIFAAIPHLGSKFEQLNKTLKTWNLPDAKVEEFRRALVPELASLCRQILGMPAPPGYRLLDQHYQDLHIWETKWKSATKVAMVAINQGVFRKRRLEFQKRKPGSYVDPTQVGKETDDEMKDRIAIELKGKEPWGHSLEKLTIIIASDEMFSRWFVASGLGAYESPAAAELFWLSYIETLKTDVAQQRRDGLRTRVPFDVELYKTNYIDFVGHYFDYDRAGGYITGTHLLSGNEAPLAFEVEWPIGTDAPKHFRAFTKALDDIRRNSEILYPPPLLSKG